MIGASALGSQLQGTRWGGALGAALASRAPDMG